MLHERADKDALISQYAEFRRLVRYDIAVLAKATAEAMEVEEVEEQKGSQDEAVAVAPVMTAASFPAPALEAEAGQKRPLQQSPE